MLIENLIISFIGFPEFKVTERDQRAATKISGNRRAVYRKIQVRSVTRLGGIPVTDKRLFLHWLPMRSRENTRYVLRPTKPCRHYAPVIIA
jgi:hypothetical protein